MSTTPEALDIERTLAFVNTASGRSTAAPTERFTSYEALIAWARETGLLRPDDAERLNARARRRAADAERMLTRAKRLRELLHDTFTALAGGRPPASSTLDTLSAELAAWYVHGRLAASDEALQWVYCGGDDLDRPLLEVARAATRLLTSPRLARIRACAAADCGWWFVDDTKNASRRWCDMKICGNRDKVRRFRERQRT